MESFLKDSTKAKGVEVLFFEEAQVEKIKGSSKTFASVGPLSVLYVKEYHRFVLHLNDWKYPLLRRLRIMSTSEKNDLSSTSYMMPATNGFSYQLTLMNVPNRELLANFETILRHNSDFYHHGEEITSRDIEASPEHKLVRKSSKDHTIKDVAFETVNHIISNIKEKFHTVKTTAHKKKSMKKQPVDLSKIKKQNFRKNAKSSFKKSFFTTNEKLTHEFVQKRKENKNLREVQEFNDLMKTNEHHAPVQFISKIELEDSILNLKDLATKGSFIKQSSFEERQGQQETEKKVEKKDIVQDLKTDLQGLKQTVEKKADQIFSGSRVQGSELKKDERVTGLEGTTHYEA